MENRQEERVTWMSPKGRVETCQDDKYMEDIPERDPTISVIVIK